MSTSPQHRQPARVAASRIPSSEARSSFRHPPHTGTTPITANPTRLSAPQPSPGIQHQPTKTPRSSFRHVQALAELVELPLAGDALEDVSTGWFETMW